MSTWTDVFLGIIAVATLATAIVQIGVLVAAGRLARRLGRLVDQVEREMKPLFGHSNAIARDASRAAALPTARSSASTRCSRTSPQTNRADLIAAMSLGDRHAGPRGPRLIMGFQAVLAAHP